MRKPDPAPTGDHTRRSLSVDAAAAACFLVGSLSLTGLVAVSGVPLGAAALSASVLALNAVACSVLWLWGIRRPRSLAEFAGVGIAAAIVVLALVALVTPTGWPRIVVFVVAPVAALAVRLTRRREFATRIALDPASLLGAAVATGAALVVSRWQWQRYDLGQIPTFMSIQPDIVFFEVLAQANGQFGHFELGVLSDWPIRYHWLAYGLIGSLQAAVASPPFVELTRTVPFLLIGALALLAAGWSRRLTAARWVPILAALSVTVGRLVADSAGTTISWDSPSQTMAEVVLLGVLVAATAFPTARRRRVLTLAFVTAAVFVLVGMKVSAAAVALAAICAIGAGAWFRGTRSLRSVWLVVAPAIAAVCAWVLFVAGQAASGGLRLVRPGPLWATLSDWGTSTPAPLAVLLAVAPGWLGIAYALRRHGRHRIAAAHAALGCALAGLVPVWLLVDARPNTTWFLNAAVVPVWIVASAGAAEGVRRLRLRPAHRRRFLVAAGLSAIALSIGWGWLVSHEGLLRDHAQVVFVALLVPAGAVPALALGTLRARRLATGITAGVVLVGSICVVTNILAERAFPIPIAGIESSEFAATTQPATAWDYQPKATAQDAAALSTFLAQHARAGEVIAVPDDGLLPAAALNHLRPYVSRGRYAMDLGPAGTDVELARRRALVTSAVTGDRRAITALCDDGVRWLTNERAPGATGDAADWTTITTGVAVARLHCDR